MYKIDRRWGEGVQKSFSRKLPNCIIRIEYNLDLDFRVCLVSSLSFQEFVFQEFFMAPPVRKGNSSVMSSLCIFNEL